MPPKNPAAFIIGATSSLAYAICSQLAAEGWNMVLSGRDKKELERLKSDLEIRWGIKAETLIIDLAAMLNAENIIKEAEKKLKPFDAVFMIAGHMGDQKNQATPENIEQVTNVNYTIPAQLISEAKKSMLKRKQGDIVIISSVAGDRGRQSNYIYGSAKAALSTFASGLRNELNNSGVNVLTVKPGFVDTPLTYAMNSPLVAGREAVAKTIIKAMKKRKSVIYVPCFWFFIMQIINHIPEKIFKRLKL